MDLLEAARREGVTLAELIEAVSQGGIVAGATVTVTLK